MRCNQASQAPLRYGGRWLKYKYGQAWRIDHITLPQTCQGKRHALTVVEAATGWLETYPVPHATAWNALLGLEKQVRWRHGTPERIESDNRTHFRNNLIDTWAKEHGKSQPVGETPTSIFPESRFLLVSLISSSYIFLRNSKSSNFLITKGCGQCSFFRIEGCIIPLPLQANYNSS
ncbi:LOW QUALITY PROTEIN: hypothetical protein QYF61_027621 [Mycteria americana]|uniref:Integrase catalytic domain-containing protein n=1 Tax=Mycteria americana TaxID=33587 RepID=A0AAN7SBQ0_MYCAM|nr:LOW QUALITY PROTEIN: hypothetical protein QYF61_027620 [Mycteria americana]KAK4825466.1 LOW QUALITY PROTEIN: hypothetical protein QYF61_027621 [Mycteria americana]